MKIGVIGIGKMGYNLALNMRDQGFEVSAYDIDKDALARISKENIKAFDSIKELCCSLGEHKKIWIMVPSGRPVDKVIDSLIPCISINDIVIDGGNSNYKDTIKRAKILRAYGAYFLDIGTSGGIDGARFGACMMIGGDVEAYVDIRPLIEKICVKDGFEYFGRSGSGHYVKMIHNGIEYGMLQAIAEGFEILHHSEYDLDYEKIAKVWSNGSVIRGWLMELTQNAFNKDNKLEEIIGKIDSSGEGLWTVEEALKLRVPAYVITEALLTRYRSTQDDSFTGKVIAALRNEFGGHMLHKDEE